MTLVNVTGSVGSGKTLFMTASMLYNNKPIYSNYKIKSDKYNELFPETLLEVEMSGSNIGIDEAYIWLESRLSGKPINLYMSYILFQSRKRDMDIWLTDQMSGSIDLRYRGLVDYEVKCRATPNSKHPKAFIYKIIDYTGDKPSKTRMVLPIERASMYFDSYDTFELINPIDDELISKVSKSNKNIVKQIENIADDIIIEYHNLKKFPKGIVANHCLQNDVPKSYIDKVYNLLLARSAKSI